MSKLHDELIRLNACSEAQNWAKDYKTLDDAWAKCERVDWMLWLVGKTCPSAAWSEERKQLVLCACEIARTALPHTTDARVLECIEATEAWCRGEVTQDHVSAAAAAVARDAEWDAAADAAACAAYAAAAACAADAAYAAADGADAAYAAADAACAAYAAADAVCAADADATNIVRKHYPKPPTIKESL